MRVKVQMISRARWASMVRHGYASRRGAQKYILVLDPKTQQTILQPVQIIGEIPVEE